MTDKRKYELFALISIVIAVAGQLCMKWGMSGYCVIQVFDLNVIFSILTNAFVLIGFICFVVAMFIWLYALKGLPLSYAFPLQSISIVLIFIFSWLLLHENISVMRWVGFCFIFIGIIFLTGK